MRIDRIPIYAKHYYKEIIKDCETQLDHKDH